MSRIWVAKVFPTGESYNKKTDTHHDGKCRSNAPLILLNFFEVRNRDDFREVNQIKELVTAFLNQSVLNVETIDISIDLKIKQRDLISSNFEEVLGVLPANAIDVRHMPPCRLEKSTKLTKHISTGKGKSQQIKAHSKNKSLSRNIPFATLI